MSVTIYGIKNCDTMKKARAWLDAKKHAYEFHDYKAQGVDASKLRQWEGEVGWEALVNRSGTTFRNLPDDRKSDLTAKKAVALMIEQPSLIRRPILEGAGDLLVGFKPEIYQERLG